MKIAASVLALLLIAGGIFVWQHNRRAYDMQQNLAFGQSAQQLFTEPAKWRYCDFESFSHNPEALGVPTAVLRFAHTAPMTYEVTVATYPREANGAQLSSEQATNLLLYRIGRTNEVWLATCHFSGIPRTIHVQMLLTYDSKIIRSTVPYVDDLQPNAPRLALGTN